MTKPLSPMHLIERAAARLQAEHTASVPDRPPPAWLRPPAPPGLPPPETTPPALSRPALLPHAGETTDHAGNATPADAPAHIVLDRVALERAGLVVGPQRSRVVEEYRVVATRLLREMRNSEARAGRPNLVMVTSTQPGEGKTFTALNLAATIASETVGGVLLVDVDGKLKSLSYQLGLSEHPGLTELTAKPDMRADALFVPTVIHNLTVLPIGGDTSARDAAAKNIGKRQAEGRGEDRVRPLTAVLEKLAHQFRDHIIVLDAPPCLATSDPSVLAPLVRQIVMVVEAGRTQQGELQAALDMVKGCPNIALLLNKASSATAHTFGAYHYQGKYY